MIGKSNTILSREVKNRLAVIHVRSNTNNTIRFIKGTDIIVKEFASGSGRVTKDNPNFSIWTFYVTPKEYGPWTIVAVNGTEVN